MLSTCERGTGLRITMGLCRAAEFSLFSWAPTLRDTVSLGASHLICAYGGRDVAPGDLRSKLLALRQALEHELEAIHE